MSLFPFAERFRELRRSPRFEVHYPAHLMTGDTAPLIQCTISDISADGARLALATGAWLPDEMTLLFRRRCRVVHRIDGQLGVEFV
jgi:PilZ domain